MREYLFRGKRLDNGEWVEGSLVRVPDDKFMYGAYICPEVFVVEKADSDSMMLGGFYEVDPTNVGQYTGLTDKNGKKIFEGDILKVYGYTKSGYSTGYTEVKATVKFDRLCWACGGGKSLYNYSTIDWANIEVIGNIHDNPELLEATTC